MRSLLLTSEQAVAGLLPSARTLRIRRWRGAIWQPDNATLDPRGNWHRTGASVVQWMAVDGTALSKPMPCQSLGPATLPPWQRIAGEPNGMILGLAGRFDEKARADVASGLASASAALARLPPLNVVGWVLPGRVTDTGRAPNLGHCWRSYPGRCGSAVYEQHVGPDVLVQGLMKWLPKTCFFQDGVGCMHAKLCGAPVHDVLSASRQDR
jgi:hypothetical protein